MRVCLVGYSFYETDNRKLRSARALAERGDQVDVIALRREGQPERERVDGVDVFRIQLRRRDEKGKGSYLLRLVWFLFKSSAFLTARHWRMRYDVVQVHSVPDFEVFAAWFPRLMGARIILDIYDVSPEFYLSKFGVDRTAFGYRALKLVERLACAFAHHVIIANDLWKVLLNRRSVPPGRSSVFVNYIDPRVFFPHPRTRPAGDGRFIMLYPGTLNRHQGLDVAVRAFVRVKAELPAAEFHIYGDGEEEGRLRELAASLGVGDSVRFCGVVPFRDVPGIMANADLGVVSKKSDVFGDEAYSTKILEFMSQGVPVVVPRTKIDAHYFTDRVVRFFAPGNPDDMAAAIVDLARSPERRAELVRNSRDYAAGYSWDDKKKEYLALVDRLTGLTGAS